MSNSRKEPHSKEQRQLLSLASIERAASALSRTSEFVVNQGPARLRTKIESVAGQSFQKAQKTFEKQTGWTSRKIERTLRTFEQLPALDRLFLGGLIVGNGLVKARPNRVRSASRSAAKKATPRKKSASTLDSKPNG